MSSETDVSGLWNHYRAYGTWAGYSPTYPDRRENDGRAALTLLEQRIEDPLIVRPFTAQHWRLNYE